MRNCSSVISLKFYTKQYFYVKQKLAANNTQSDAYESIIPIVTNTEYKWDASIPKNGECKVTMPRKFEEPTLELVRNLGKTMIIVVRNFHDTTGTLYEM